MGKTPEFLDLLNFRPYLLSAIAKALYAIYFAITTCFLLSTDKFRQINKAYLFVPVAYESFVFKHFESEMIE